VLNARYHEQEAPTSSPRPACPARITIATNMAGRGTDIQLGGNADMRIAQELGDMPEDEERTRRQGRRSEAEIQGLKNEALDAGGLYVLATERHESRRIDNQLRGRSGRQGDPGRSKFFLSLQDDLMRIFGSERMDGMLQTLGLKEGEAIVHPWINKALERAQKEGRGAQLRHPQEPAQVRRRDERPAQGRLRAAQGTDGLGIDFRDIEDMRHEVIDGMVKLHIPEKAYAEQWNVTELKKGGRPMLNLDLPIEEWAAEEGIAEDDIHERIVEAADKLARNAPNGSARKS
jgi:preprotein translocase subunit SecA